DREHNDQYGPAVHICAYMYIASTNSEEHAMSETRVAIVTGGSGGIGRVVAERLAADGLTVVLTYAGNPERADAAVEAITAAGGTASAFQADVADEQQVAAL